MRKIHRGLSALLLSVLLLGSAAAFAEGSAPVAENLELRTFRNVSVGGRLKAFDAEDDVVSYTITTEPVKGSIELEENGCFVYTPGENKRGRDYFGYKAVDSEGNLSEEATVIIRIEKQKKSVIYSDLEGQSCAYAAAALAENGIFTGEKFGGVYCFFPDRAVSRGEFLAMCAQLRPQGNAYAVFRTGYRDDDVIPAWLKSCCAAVRMSGNVPTAQSLDAQSHVSATEAAEWLNAVLDLTEIRYPVGNGCASQACMNMLAHDIPVCEQNAELTRAQAAEMLAAALRLVG